MGEQNVRVRGCGRLWLGRLGLLWLLACGGEAPRPDVILVTWDTVRADHVGSHEGTSVTPNLDALAREGVSFVEARTPVPITLPAHASLLTGLFPASHGVRDNGTFRLDPGISTLTERLAAEGYATAAFVSAQVLERSGGLARDFRVYDDRVDYRADVHAVASRPADQTVDAAIDWLRDTPRSEPVFLWVHLYDPHRLWEAPAPWSDRFDPYRAEIAFSDDETGRLLRALDETGRLPRSIVTLTSDHGEGLGEHGEETHSYFAYESTMRVPLLLWAGEALNLTWNHGARVRGPASLVDLAPTLLELLALPPLEADGRSLVRSLTEGIPVEGRVHPLETVAPAYSFGTAPVFGVLTEDGHTFFDLPRREHYDLNQDPAQLVNLYTEAEAMQADALFAGSSRAWPPENDALMPDRETLAALEALGYVAGTSLPSDDEPLVDPKDRVELANFITVNSKLLTPSQALEEGARLHERFGALPALARFRAQLLDSIGRSLDAIEVLAESANAHPDNVLLEHDLEERRREQSEREKLARTIRTVLAQEPDHPRARHDLALTLHQLQQTEEAQALYEAILAADASDDAARLNLVRLLMAEGRPQEAYARVEEGRTRPDYDYRLDCAAGRILAWYLDRPASAVAPLRACRDAGARLTPLDIAAMNVSATAQAR